MKPEDHLKAARTSAVGLVAVLILALFVYDGRRRLRADLLSAEELYLAHALSALPAEQASFSTAAPLYDGPTAQLDDAWSTYLKAAAQGEIAGLGVLELELPWTLYRETDLWGGRKIFFTAIPPGEEEQEWLAANADTFEACEDAGQPIFLQPIEIEKGEHGESDILGEAQVLWFTNRALTYLPSFQWYCWESGPIKVYFELPTESSLPEGFSSDALASRVVAKASLWGYQGNDPAVAYGFLASKYDASGTGGEVVRVPVLGLDIPARLALLALASIAVALGAWASHLLWKLSRYSTNELDAGFWLGLASAERWFGPVPRASRAVAGVETIVGLGGLLTVVAAPMIVGWLALWEALPYIGLLRTSLPLALAIVSTTFTASMASSSLRLITRAKSSADRAT